MAFSVLKQPYFLCILRFYCVPDSLHFSLFFAFFRRSYHKYKPAMRLSWNVDISQFSVWIIGQTAWNQQGI